MQTLLIHQAKKFAEKFNLLVIGNGAAFMGADLNAFNIPAVSLASSEQDLYYSYLCLKMMLETPNNLKYVLIGVSPYSFFFDLSQSKKKFSALAYYPAFRDMHNLKISNKVLREIFNEKFLNLWDILNTVDNEEIADFNDPFNYRKSVNQPLQIQELFGLRATVGHWQYEKNYNVINENVQILNDCIKLCRKQNVTPIVVTFPANEMYKDFFPQSILNKFYTLMEDIKQAWNLYFLDYWNLKNFGYENFCTIEYLNLQGASRITRRISNFIDKLESKKIRVAFTMQITSSWPKIIPLYKKMCENQNFDLYGIIIPNDPKASPRIKPVQKYGSEYEYYHNLYDNDENITLIDAVNPDGKLIDLEDFNFDYVFYLRPYDYVFAPPFQCKMVSKFAKTFHLMYGLLVSENFISFYLGFHDFYNRLNFFFAESEKYAQIFRQFYKSNETHGEQQFLFCGVPEIEQECKDNETAFFENLDKPKKNLLWTPRWTYAENIGGSHFIEYKDEFTALRKKYPAAKMIVRPHPNLFSQMQAERRMTESDVANYKKSLQKNNIVLDETPTYTETLAAADIMITDVTSIMINFFLTGKPIIYCPFKYKLFGDFEDMEQGLYIANNWQEVEKYTEMLLSGEDPLKDKRAEIFKLLYSRHANACERIIQTLIDDYNSEKLGE